MSRRYKSDVRTCPDCRGLQVVEPFAQRSDPPCGMCNGHGCIRPVAHTPGRCECGAVSTMYVNGKPNCGKAVCWQRGLAPPPNPTQRPSVEAQERWWDMFGSVQQYD